MLSVGLRYGYDSSVAHDRNVVKAFTQVAPFWHGFFLHSFISVNLKVGYSSELINLFGTTHCIVEGLVIRFLLT